MIINVTQTDIDNANPESSDHNCAVLAIRRAKPRAKKVKVWALNGKIRIGVRFFELDQYATNRMIRHSMGDKIAPFEFEIEGLK